MMGSSAWFENLGGDTSVRERERVAVMCTGEIVAV
jgi:hypothetical protein